MRGVVRFGNNRIAALPHMTGVEEVIFLGYHDDGVEPLALRHNLVREIRRFKPDNV